MSGSGISLAGLAGLAESDVVEVDVFLAPAAIPLRNFGADLVIGPTANVISVGERLRVYTTLPGVVTDFGTTTPEYAAADLFFSQNPNPSILYVGRWAQSATEATLQGGTLSAANQVISGWTAITTGSMAITIDGTVKTLSTLNFAAQTNMNGVAGVIQTALGGSIICNWNASFKRFEIFSSTTGASSTITYASATGSGVDISAKACLTAATGAKAPINGIVAETPLAAATALAGYGAWYGACFSPTNSTDITDAQYVAVAGFIEATTPRRTFFYTSMEASLIDPTQSSDLASQLSALEYNRAFVQYSSSSAYAAASAMARLATVNFQGNNTTITLKFKTEPGVAPENLNETQAAAVKAKSANVYTYYQNGVAIIQEGVMASGQFADTIVGADWLQNQIQTDIFNLFYSSTTKVPQTDPGMHLIATTIENTLIQAINNGYIAPGQWNAPGFGLLQTGQYLTKGYYIYVPPVSSQDQSDRQARKSVVMQVAVKLAGAVHFANVQINVNA